jgi:hypothetical protein
MPELTPLTLAGLRTLATHARTWQTTANLLPGKLDALLDAAGEREAWIKETRNLRAEHTALLIQRDALQARVEEFGRHMAECDTKGDALDIAEARLDDAEARVAALEGALEFYADPMTYFAVGIFADRPCGEFVDDMSETDEYGMKPGKLARAALAAGRGEAG